MLPTRRGSNPQLLTNRMRIKLSHQGRAYKVLLILIFRGEQFRKDYSKLGELRSLLPKANFLALTATASPEDRKIISKALCLNNTSEVIASCNRSNIFHVSIKAPNELHASFSWLVSDLKTFKKTDPKNHNLLQEHKSMWHHLQVFERRTW